MSEEEVKERLSALEEWKREGNAITRTYEFPSFREAIGFIDEVATLADAAGHHPDIFNSWRTVTLSLTTHDEGGLTDRDFALAEQIEAITSE